MSHTEHVKTTSTWDIVSLRVLQLLSTFGACVTTFPNVSFELTDDVEEFVMTQLNTLTLTSLTPIAFWVISKSVTLATSSLVLAGGASKSRHSSRCCSRLTTLRLSICPGQPFAEASIFLYISAMLSTFSISQIEGSTPLDPNDFENLPS